MKIAQKYSHLNGEEYLIVHFNHLYKEIQEVIAGVDASKFMTKVSKEKRKEGLNLYAPQALNDEYKLKFGDLDWKESRYSYYITLDRDLMEQSISMTAQEQRKFLIENGIDKPIFSYNQTDFVKDK